MPVMELDKPKDGVDPTTKYKQRELDKPTKIRRHKNRVTQLPKTPGQRLNFPKQSTFL
jgi:hypothetical protein